MSGCKEMSLKFFCFLCKYSEEDLVEMHKRFERLPGENSSNKRI